jgi:hypothetical protein
MYDPSAGASVAPTSDSSSRGARYAYLVGRLRNRQITMEEATELFGLMQGMLQRSEAGRLAAAAAAGTAPPPSPPGPSPAVPSAGLTGAPAMMSDDTILLGLLALGVGAGLVTAVTKRFHETSLVAPTTSSGSSTPQP